MQNQNYTSAKRNIDHDTVLNSLTMFSEYTMYLGTPLSLFWATSPTLWYQSPKLNPLYTAYSQVCKYSQYKFMNLSNSPPEL